MDPTKQLIIWEPHSYEVDGTSRRNIPQMLHGAGNMHTNIYQNKITQM